MRSRERQSTTKSMSVADLKALHLAPDARVPDNERDDLHKRGRRRLGHLGWAGVAAGGVAGVAGIVWGISHAGGETKSVVPESNPTTATGSATAGETTAPSPEQTVSIEEMSAMTPEEFGTLPVESQVDWVVTEANKEWNGAEGYDSEVLGSLLSEPAVGGALVANYNPVYVSLGANPEPLDIIGQYVYYDQLSIYKNADTGRKLISGLAFPGSPAYEYLYGTVGDTPDNPLGVKDPAEHTVLSSEMLDGYVSADGTKYPQMAITEKDGSGDTYLEVYTFVESKVLQDLKQKPGLGLWLLTNFDSVK